MFRRILVPLDGAEHSWRALEYACELVRLSGGSLVIMTVTPGKILQPVLETGDGCLYFQIGDEVLEAAHALLDSRNIDCTYLLENDNEVAESILRTVKDEKCDGIVLGSRGMGVLEGLLRSSVSRVVLENANVPVTIIK